MRRSPGSPSQWIAGRLARPAGAGRRSWWRALSGSAGEPPAVACRRLVQIASGAVVQVSGLGDRRPSGQVGLSHGRASCSPPGRAGRGAPRPWRRSSSPTVAARAAAVRPYPSQHRDGDLGVAAIGRRQREVVGRVRQVPRSVRGERALGRVGEGERLRPSRVVGAGGQHPPGRRSTAPARPGAVRGTGRASAPSAPSTYATDAAHVQDDLDRGAAARRVPAADMATARPGPAAGPGTAGRAGPVPGRGRTAPSGGPARPVRPRLSERSSRCTVGSERPDRSASSVSCW